MEKIGNHAHIPASVISTDILKSVSYLSCLGTFCVGHFKALIADCIFHPFNLASSGHDRHPWAVDLFRRNLLLNILDWHPVWHIVLPSDTVLIPLIHWNRKSHFCSYHPCIFVLIFSLYNCNCRIFTIFELHDTL